MVLLKRKKTWNMLLDKSIITEESLKKMWFKFYKPDIYKFIQDNSISLMPDNFEVLVSKFEELRFWNKFLAIESTQKDYEEKLNECDMLTRKAIANNVPVIKNPMLIIPFTLLNWFTGKNYKVDYSLTFSYLVLENGKYIPYQLSQSTSSSGKVILDKQYTESEAYEIFYSDAMANVFWKQLPNSEAICNSYLSKSVAMDILLEDHCIRAHGSYLNNTINGALFNLSVGYNTQDTINDEILNKINFNIWRWFYLNSNYRKDFSVKIKKDSYLNYFRPSILIWAPDDFQSPEYNRIYQTIFKETRDFYKENMFYLISRGEILPSQVAIQFNNFSTDRDFEAIIDTIDSLNVLTEEEFERKYPFVFCKSIRQGDFVSAEVGKEYWIRDSYLNYYGKEAPEGHLTNIPRMWKSPKLAKLMYETKITNINQLTEKMILEYFGELDKIAKTDYGRYLIKVLKKEEQSFELPAVKSLLECYKGKKLFFYDYETISSAFPVLEGTRIFDQAVAQYSCHYLSPDGTVSHSDYLLKSNEKNYFNLLIHFANFVFEKCSEKDFTDDSVKFVVWNASFEKSRNKEIIKVLQNINSLKLHNVYWINEQVSLRLIKFLELVNNKTLDLADFFKDRYVYYKKLEGKWSLKNVFPLYSDKLSYNNLNIQKGDVASTKIFDMLVWNIKDPIAIEKIRKDLLEYCGLDTLSMVIIYADIANKAGNTVKLNFKG